MKQSEIRSATSLELVKRFEETAVIHGQLRSPREANRAFDEGVRIWKELKGRGTEATSLFLRLFRSPNPAVRMNAAGLAIFDSPDEALPVLQELTKEPRSIGVSAFMTLREWHAGRLKPLA